MRVSHLNIGLSLAFLASFGLMWASRRDVHQPNLEFMPDMAHARRHDAFEPNPVLPGGQTLQRPPAGTVARGWPVLQHAGTPGDALRAGQELSNPNAEDDEQARARGELVFRTFCVPCHGAGGAGDGLAAQQGVPPPPSLLAEHAVSMRDGQMFHVLTFGQANMASYASQVSREDRWRVIRYIRWLQTAAPGQATAATEPPR